VSADAHSLMDAPRLGFPVAFDRAFRAGESESAEEIS
jgi:hypothetical protein